MNSNKRFSIDDLRNIGYRLKSLRSLTGLNQEEFSHHSGIPHMTIKGWELGRSLPRDTSLKHFLKALNGYGLQVSCEWIVYGNGQGPTYNLKPLDNTSEQEELVSCKLMIDSFKKEQHKKGKNPVLINVSDDLMEPIFNIGDTVGGVITSLEDVILMKDVRFCLIPSEKNSWVARRVFFNKHGVYFGCLKDNNIYKLDTTVIAAVNWHYRNLEQT